MERTKKSRGHTCPVEILRQQNTTGLPLYFFVSENAMQRSCQPTLAAPACFLAKEDQKFLLVKGLFSKSRLLDLRRGRNSLQKKQGGHYDTPPGGRWSLVKKPRKPYHKRAESTFLKNQKKKIPINLWEFIVLHLKKSVNFIKFIDFFTSNLS